MKLVKFMDLRNGEWCKRKKQKLPVEVFCGQYCGYNECSNEEVLQQIGIVGKTAEETDKAIPYNLVCPYRKDRGK